MSVLLYFYREGKRMQRVREQVQVPEQIYSVTWRSEPVTVAVLDTGNRCSCRCSSCLCSSFCCNLGSSLCCFFCRLFSSLCRMMITDMEPMYVASFAETENCRVEGFGEWHRHRNLSWEKCWMEREKDPVIPCRRHFSGSYG